MKKGKKNSLRSAAKHLSVPDDAAPKAAEDTGDQQGEDADYDEDEVNDFLDKYGLTYDLTPEGDLILENNGIEDLDLPDDMKHIKGAVDMDRYHASHKNNDKP